MWQWVHTIIKKYLKMSIGISVNQHQLTSAVVCDTLISVEIDVRNFSTVKQIYRVMFLLVWHDSFQYKALHVLVSWWCVQVLHLILQCVLFEVGSYQKEYVIILTNIEVNNGYHRRRHVNMVYITELNGKLKNVGFLVVVIFVIQGEILCCSHQYIILTESCCSSMLK